MDVHDLKKGLGSAIDQRLLRKIELKADYSLCPETANSYWSDADTYRGTPLYYGQLDEENDECEQSCYGNAENCPSECWLTDPEPPSVEQTGKLTLKAVKMYGKGSADLLPPTQFEYGHQYDVTSSGFLISETFDNYTFNQGVIVTDKSNKLNEGDIFKCKIEGDRVLENSEWVYGLVLAISTATDKSITFKPTGNKLPWFPTQTATAEPGVPRTFVSDKSTAKKIVDLQKTDNPPYHQDYWDVWNMYKPDFNLTYTVTEEEEGENGEIVSNDTEITIDENLARTTTEVSARYADAWSLKKIRTPLGSSIKIDYESDSHREPEIYAGKKFSVLDVTPVEGSTDEVRIQVAPFLFDPINEVDIKVGKEISLFLALRHEGISYKDTPTVPNSKGQPRSASNKFFYVTFSKINASIASINRQAGYISLKDAKLFQKLASIYANGEEVNLEQIRSGVYNAESQLADDRGEIVYDTKAVFENLPEFFAANLLLRGKQEYQGGGIRVKNLTLTNPTTSQQYVTSYDYTAGDGYSSGVTSYTPEILDPVKFEVDEDEVFYATRKDYPAFYNGPSINNPERLNQAKYAYRDFVFADFNKILTNAREIPPPSVVYEYVTVRNQVVQDDGTVHYNPLETRHQFQVFRGDMVIIDHEPEIVRTRTNTYDGIQYNNIRAKRVAIKDYSSPIGSLKRMTQYTASGVISEVENHYLLDELLVNPTATYDELLARYRHQGQVHEVFGDARFVARGNSKHELLAVISARQQYPNIMTGTTTTNYKTGVKQTTRNLAFDFFSGLPTEVLTEDSYGNKYVSVSTPAYRQYPAMGLKVTDAGNKHMLSQGAQTVTYRINQNFDPRQQTDYSPEALVSASVQTWSDQVDVLGANLVEQTNVWRQHRRYVWTGDGITPQADGTARMADYKASPFNAWQYEQQPASPWERQAEITLYDPYSHALEAKDVNDNYVATRMDNDQRLVLATTANAHYDEFAYSGAEELAEWDFEGGVAIGDLSEATPAFSHTGQYSLGIRNDSRCFVFTPNETRPTSSDRAYRASVWVYVQNDLKLADAQLYAQVKKSGKTETLTQSAQQTDIQAGAWHLITLDIPAGGTISEVGCRNRSNSGISGTIYFDDFRFHPLEASMTAYVYDAQTDELTHILDADNFYTRFEYDDIGRLVATYREIQHVVERQIDKRVYHYQENYK